jgi:hypothetical protein
MKQDGIHFTPITPTPDALYVDSHVVWSPRRTPAATRGFIDCMISETYEASVVQTNDGFGIEWTRATFERTHT